MSKGSRANFERLLQSAWERKYLRSSGEPLPLVFKEKVRENHYREYIVAGVGAIAEYLSLRYGIGWLAWLAALFFWLAIADYSKKYSGWKRSGLCFLSAAIMVFVTYFLTTAKASILTEPKALSVPTAPPPVVASDGGAYSVGIETYMVDFPTGFLWTFPNHRETLCAVPIGLFIHITNKQPIPAMISRFDVEILKAGVWEQTGHVNPTDVYFGTRQSYLRSIKADFFDELVRNKNVSSGETIRGWLLLTVLRTSSQKTRETDPQFRIVVADFGGATYTTKPLRSVQESEQPVSFVIFEPEDLSKFQPSLDCGD
jgi:hypothetical protein